MDWIFRDVGYDTLSDVERLLIDKAEGVMENSFNPYSGFYVGCALLSVGGQIVTGTNYEAASMTPATCSERAALVKANSMGIREFYKIAIIAKSVDGPTTEVTAPCGVCRQVLYEVTEISGKDLEIILSTTNRDKIVITSARKLLPMPFGPGDLGIDLTRFRTQK